MKKSQIIKPKNGFFSFVWLNKKYPKYKDVKLKVILAPRNVGKTYGTYEYYFSKGYFKPDKKVCIFRITDIEVKTAKRDFEDRFSQFMVVGDSIYIKEFSIKLDKNKKEVKIPTKGELVGYFASLNNFQQKKSIEAKNVSAIFIEEFNEVSHVMYEIYFKFYNLIKTFSRFNEPEIIMLGNKDAFRNDFFIAWEIDIEDTTHDDYIKEIWDKDKTQLIGVWYDLSASNFTELRNDRTTANLLATLDPRTDNYAGGGFKDPANDCVQNYKKYVDFFKPLLKLATRDNIYTLGKLIDTDYYAIISVSNADFPKLKNAVSMDISGGLEQRAYFLDEESETDLNAFIYDLMRKRRLIFDSYDAYELFRIHSSMARAYLQKERE